MAEEKKNILIIEDHPIFRLGMGELINQEKDLIVCGYAEDVPDALSRIRMMQPDLVITDITLKEGNGLELVEELKRTFKTLPVLVLSMHEESEYAEEALSKGARGYLMKQEAMETVVRAVRQVLAGKVFVSENIKEKILFQLVDMGARPERSPVERLTGRESEVFRLIGQGFTTREIAEKLYLSMKTIGTYRERIKEKLELKHSNELIKHAVLHTQRASHRA